MSMRTRLACTTSWLNKRHHFPLPPLRLRVDLVPVNRVLLQCSVKVDGMEKEYDEFVFPVDVWRIVSVSLSIVPAGRFVGLLKIYINELFLNIFC